MFGLKFCVVVSSVFYLFIFFLQNTPKGCEFSINKSLITSRFDKVVNEKKKLWGFSYLDLPTSLFIEVLVISSQQYFKLEKDTIVFLIFKVDENPIINLR
jgi:hypothetical protein